MNSIHNPDVLSCLANLSNDEVFTPPNIANQMLDLLPNEIWYDKDIKFLDPCCKSGIFLREIVKRLNSGLKKSIPDTEKRIAHILKNQVYGIAITQLTALMSRRTVYCTKHANSRFSVYNGFENDSGNIIFDNISHKWKKDKCEYCGASKLNYDRDDERESHAYQFIHTANAEEIFNMKFDVIIGNPPYQMSDGGFGVSAKPIYHKFVQQAKKLDPRYLIMIIPSRWFAGGKGLDEFRNEMLNDNRIRQIHDYPEAKDCFQGTQIKGGVCYFLWDRDNEGLCKVYSYKQSNMYSMLERPLLENQCSMFIRYNETISIIDKTRKYNEISMSSMISSRKPFGLSTTYKGKPDKFNNSITLYQRGGVAFIDRNEILTNHGIMPKYKVLISPLGSGSDSFPHSILGKAFLAEPDSVCTETYLVAGAFDDKNQAENLIIYLSTKFLRFLVLQNKPTQHATKKVYAFVPIQDFTEPWTDEKLYKKYNLTDDEISFIESMIKPMGETSDINTADIENDIDDTDEK